MKNLAIGTRMYNHGDMANAPHFAEIIDRREDPNGSWQYHLRPEGDGPAYHGSYWIREAQVDEVFLGHSGTRIVTAEAYKTFRDRQIAQLRASIS